MDKTAGVITELLPLAEAEALREFLQHYAANHTEFAVDFGQWLMRKYARHASIRRFATLPHAQPLANALVARLRTTFARRPAYLEELGKV